MMNSNMKNNFTFEGVEYNYSKLRNFEVVKVYTKSSHFDRRLLKDKENERLFLYEFYEYENWNGGNDEIYETFALVKNEEDADTLNLEKPIRRHPYIYVRPDYTITIE